MSASAPNERPLRVLVVDDHPTNRAVIEVILDLVEAELVLAEDGAQAVAAYKAGSFDVVLMDLQMPVMDGLTATREIRKYEAETGRRRTPILAVSANAMSDHVAASRAAGCDHHVPKPVIPDTLLRLIAQSMEEAHAAAPSARAAS